MNQHKNTFRLTALLTVVAIILGIYVFRLQNVQIAQAKAAKNVRTDTYTYYTRVTAARGELLDCNGKVLMKDRKLLVIDEKALMQECRESANRLWHSIND